MRLLLELIGKATYSLSISEALSLFAATKMSHQPAVATGAPPKVEMTYQTVDFKTCHLQIFPEPADAFDRVEISSDAAAVAALDASLIANLGTNTAAPGSQPVPAGTTPAVNAGTVANQSSSAITSPRIRCTATLYFRGLEASLLCEYDRATSTISNFQIVTGNDHWLRSNIQRFSIGHAVSWPLHNGSKEDRNGK